MTQPAPQAEARKEEAKMAPAQQPPAAQVNPDTVLAARVKAALGSDGSINVHRIDVTSESGVVTLYGTADTADQRTRAGEIASAVAGVRSVENKLAIVAGS
jgi:osmotically-inducible protein OsmY